MNDFYVKTRIIFGDTPLNYLEKFKEKRVFVVADPYILSSGKIDDITNHLSLKEIFIFSKIEPDPHTEIVIRGIKDLQGFRPQVVIAVGGGSAIDTAKAIVHLAGKMGYGDVTEFVAIPTTSGTGSEVTSFAVITDKEKNVKYPLTDKKMIPDVAILDTGFLTSIPSKVVADSGVDVLTHGIEAYVSRNSSQISDILAEWSIESTFKYLRRSFRSASDMEAREKMHIASCMAGIAFNNAGLGLNHALAHSLGGIFHVSHGRMNAVLLPKVIAFNQQFGTQKYNVLSQKLFGKSDRLIQEITALNRELRIPCCLKELGLLKEDIINKKTEIINYTLQDICVGSNPVKVTRESLEKLYDSLWEG